MRILRLKYLSIAIAMTAIVGLAGICSFSGTSASANMIQGSLKPACASYDSALYSLQTPIGWRHESSVNYKAAYFRKYKGTKQVAVIGIVLWLIPAGFVPEHTASDLKKQVAGVWKSKAVNHNEVIVADTSVDAITFPHNDVNGLSKAYMTLPEKDWVMGIDVVEEGQSNHAEILSILKGITIKKPQIIPYALQDFSVKIRR